MKESLSKKARKVIEDGVQEFMDAALNGVDEGGSSSKFLKDFS